MLWPAIVAAVLPLDLATLLKRWPRVLARIVALDPKVDPTDPDDRSRPKQLTRFRVWFKHKLAPVARPANC